MPCPHCPHCRAARAATISSTIAALQLIRDTLATGEPCTHPAGWVTSTPSGQGSSTEICACGAVGARVVGGGFPSVSCAHHHTAS